MAIEENDKQYSCWNCYKFQETDPVGGVYDGTGICRGLPPGQCCALGEVSEPVYPNIVWGPGTWCAAWKRRGAESNPATLPDPVEPPE